MMKNLIQRSHKELKLFLIYWKHIFMILFINAYIFTIPARNLVFFLDTPINKPQIQDIFFRLLPEFKNDQIQNVPVSILMIFSLPIMLVLPFFYQKCHNKGVYAMNNFVIAGYYLTLMHFIRVVNYNITIIPDPSPHCRLGEKIERPQNFYGMVFLIVFVES